MLRAARDSAGAVRAEAEGQAAAARSRAEAEATDLRKEAKAQLHQAQQTLADARSAGRAPGRRSRAPRRRDQARRARCPPAPPGHPHRSAEPDRPPRRPERQIRARPDRRVRRRGRRPSAEAIDLLATGGPGTDVGSRPTRRLSSATPCCAWSAPQSAVPPSTPRPKPTTSSNSRPRPSSRARSRARLAHRPVGELPTTLEASLAELAAGGASSTPRRQIGATLRRRSDAWPAASSTAARTSVLAESAADSLHSPRLTAGLLGGAHRMAGSVILAGARTPIGKLSGALASFSATELGGFAIKAALERAGRHARAGRLRVHGPGAPGRCRADHGPPGRGQRRHPDDRARPPRSTRCACRASTRSTWPTS